jgi:hypothetical protein
VAAGILWENGRVEIVPFRKMDKPEQKDTVKCNDVMIEAICIILSIYIFPLILCVIDKFFYDFPIGIFVLFYPFFATFIIITNLWFLLAPIGCIYSFILSVAIGLVLGFVLSMYFIFLAYMFGASADIMVLMSV